ncbi:uncharacterized protein N7469_008283 [Penicillium citrinum]|uniref:Uncharacterized protein n=2 Tax=Penicillium TaxID=5073 RepID=A0A9W9TKQ8_PENCI|nr:uncharacterized protein N7469_008283 [Penicillium citrinum]KAJ5224780.1 hypothetical protein N7469_008283 [Penicillium citrinum]KAJ5575035.1 hypothetical protein N7450_008934 [Penicillium hetheringtonii]
MGQIDPSELRGNSLNIVILPYSYRCLCSLWIDTSFNVVMCSSNEIFPLGGEAEDKIGLFGYIAFVIWIIRASLIGSYGNLAVEA